MAVDERARVGGVWVDDGGRAGAGVGGRSGARAEVGGRTGAGAGVGAGLPRPAPAPTTPARPRPRLRTEAMRCPACGDMQDVLDGAVSHKCTACRAVFWWALCDGCSALQRVPDRVESWHCGCGSWNRSWWRTPDRDAAASAVASRRAERSRLLPRPSRATVLGIVAALIVAAALSVQMSRRHDRATHVGATPACSAFRDFRSRLTAGGSPSANEVVQRAESAPDDVRDAARRLAASLTSGDPDAQLAAISAMAALCPAV